MSFLFGDKLRLIPIGLIKETTSNIVALDIILT